MILKKSLVVTLPYLWKKLKLRETARQLRIDPETICRWRLRDGFRSTCEVEDRPCVGRHRVTSARRAGTRTGF